MIDVIWAHFLGDVAVVVADKSSSPPISTSRAVAHGGGWGCYAGGGHESSYSLKLEVL